MNQAQLTELQSQRAYPSITVLLNTNPNTTLAANEIDTAHRLAWQADRRLKGDVCDDVRNSVVGQLRDLIEAQTSERSTKALALCVSPDYQAAVRLGRHVNERVVIDDTFATRDLVADLNRTAKFRVVTLSERAMRVLVGDRARLLEQVDETWPLIRGEEDNAVAWNRLIIQQLRAEHQRYPLPTILAGVQRSIRHALTSGLIDTIGIIPGNHDRTNWTELHRCAWPLVVDWLRSDEERAAAEIEQAISANRYAGGIHEIWPLSNDGRVATLVVEESFMLPVRIDANNQLHPAEDREHPDVNDDIIDDTIEAVLHQGGSVVIVTDGALESHQRIAAVLRY